MTHNPDQIKAALSRSFAPFLADEMTLDVIDDLRKASVRLAYQIHRKIPNCRERSIALTRLDECFNWASRAIVRERGKADIGPEAFGDLGA